MTKNLPDGFARAGTKQGEYDADSLDLMEIKISPDGQVVVGITEWFGRMCLEGNEQAIALLLSLSDLVRDTVVQHLKVQ